MNNPTKGRNINKQNIMKKIRKSGLRRATSILVYAGFTNNYIPKELNIGDDNFSLGFKAEVFLPLIK